MGLPVHLRERLADFHLGAPVFSADGTHVGSLQRVVVDRESWDPQQVVVKESARFNGHLLALAAGLMTDELIVPLPAILQVSRDRVELSLTSREVRRLPPYLSYQLGPVSPVETAKEAISIVFGAMRLPPQVEEADKPPEDIEIRPGENVMLGHQGHRLGQVRDILFDGGELVGIVVHPTGFLQQDVLIQVRFLERGDDAALFVHMTPEDLQHLRPFQPEDR
jgi:sporulation protein YlmC with PRC-barrel domain